MTIEDKLYKSQRDILLCHCDYSLVWPYISVLNNESIWFVTNFIFLFKNGKFTYY